MEFPSLNEHCQNIDCNQTDFLPLVCKCGKKFCRDHFNLHVLSNQCESDNKSEKCNRVKREELYKCASKGCNKSDFHEFMCPKCHEHFCIEHRFHPSCPEVDDEIMAIKIQQYEEPRKQLQVSNIKLQEKITENIRKALQSSTKVKTATKIHLMRIKQKAQNTKCKMLQTISPNERLYFSVVKPKNMDSKPVKIVDDESKLIDIKTVVIDPNLKDTVPLFICSKWTLGKSLDAICECCNIKNENNTNSFVKLRMFRQIDGYCISPLRMDIEIEELIKNQILSEGDRLTNEYIDSQILLSLDETSQLFLANICNV